MSVFKDLTGNRYGRLVVLNREHSDGKHIYWSCRCDCGKETVVCGDSLKRGATKSCGCFNSELITLKATKHGQSNTRLYKCWIEMKYRCYNSNHNRYYRYGGRGIKVCDLWLHDFQPFYEWAISNGYNDGLTLDRIDNNGDYEPSNCQWLSRSENVKKMWRDRRK